MANGHGGSRPNSGRKSTKAEYIDDGLLSPLQLMLSEMRNESNPMPMRLDIAYKAAPYCSAKLVSQTLDVEGDVSIQLVSYLDHNTDSAD